MKKLLASSALALIAFASAASAQSVLERVLGQIDNATNLASVNGTFANIAENIGGSTAVRVYETVVGGEIISEADYLAGLTLAAEAAAAAVTVPAMPSRADYPDTTAGNAAYATDLGIYDAAVTAREAAYNGAVTTYEAAYTDMGLVAVDGLAGVNGSINNIVDGLTDVTQQALAGVDVSAIQWDMPTMDFGDMATTALGAVNTGDITLGVNASVDEAKTTSTNAVSTVMGQIGGSADAGAIVLNIASNMTGVNGSINNTMTEVNGTIGKLSTTALGAVNTGTIISGVDSAVQGIIGTSGANVASN